MCDSNETTQEDILKAFLQFTDTIGVGLTQLYSVTTDRAVAMIGINKGAVGLLKKHFMNHRLVGKLINLLYVVHQEALCSRTTNLHSVMNKPYTCILCI